RRRDGLEGRRAVEAQALTGPWMGEGQHAGVQAQPLVGGEGLGVGVESVAKQWMADSQHVHPQLMGAAGDRGQLDSAVVAAALQYAPEGQGMAAVLEADHVARLGRRVVA